MKINCSIILVLLSGTLVKAQTATITNSNTDSDSLRGSKGKAGNLIPVPNSTVTPGYTLYAIDCAGLGRRWDPLRAAQATPTVTNTYFNAPACANIYTVAPLPRETKKPVRKNSTSGS